MTTTPRQRTDVGLMALAFSAIYSLVGVTRHRAFQSNAFDLGIFDQAIWHASRFEAPGSTISGFANVLGDHFSPLILTLAPLYWVVPGPETLIVAQSLLFAASIVPVYLFLRSRLDHVVSMTLCAAYGFFWGLQRAAAFDVHEIAFAPLLVAAAILAVDRKRWALVWVTVTAIALTKEDLVPFVAALGVYLVATGERKRGAVLLGASAVTFVLLLQFVIPALNATGQYPHGGSFDTLLTRPWRIPIDLVTPPVKLLTLAMWLAPFLFLSLRSPLGSLLVPLALTRLLSESPTHWGTSFHYTAPLAPVLVMSAGDGLARVLGTLSRRGPAASHRVRRVAASAAALALLFSLFLPGGQPFWDLFDSDSYMTSRVEAAGLRALALVPAGGSVVAQSSIVPHVSRRSAIHVLQAKAPDADVVIAGLSLDPFPNGSRGEVGRLLAERRARGYRVIFEEAGWVVLRRR